MQYNKLFLFPIYAVLALAISIPLSQVLAGENKSWTDTIGISGLVEFEAFQLDGPGGGESDADLATLELGVDAELSASVSMYSLVLIEGPDHEVELDEVGLELTFGTISLNLGKQYVPFGAYESHMISDPLTLEIGETSESAALVGFEAGPAFGSFYLFNGDVDEIDKENEIDNFGASIGIDMGGFKAGLNYINSIADSDALEELFEGDEGDISGYPGGFALHVIGNLAGVTVIGEYLTASDKFIVDQTLIEPSSYNIELGYDLTLAGKEAFVALAFQGTDEALVLELPETRTLIGFGVAILDPVSLSLEYAYNEDYEFKDGGSGDDTNVFMVQIAAEF